MRHRFSMLCFIDALYRLLEKLDAIALRLQNQKWNCFLRMLALQALGVRMVFI
jgi:hypothetical protein